MTLAEGIELAEECPYPRTAYIIDVMTRFLEGDEIQAWNPSTQKWEDIEGEPSWGWSRVEYRVKE